MNPKNEVQKIGDRYSVQANIKEFSNTSITVDIYFSDNSSVEYFGQQKYTGFNKEKYLKLFDKNNITSFNINPQDVEGILPHIQSVNTLGFNIDAGIVLQIISSRNENDSPDEYTMEMITLTFTEEEKRLIESSIAKALLANKE